MSDITTLISRSSLGGGAWCSRCEHPRDLHDDSGCFNVMTSAVDDYEWTCSCEEFVPMTSVEWRKKFG